MTRDPLSSMDYWFPLTQDCGVPFPKTGRVQIPPPLQEAYKREEFSDISSQLLADECRKRVKELGLSFPVFLRTDNSANKHNWKRTCFVEKPEQFEKHIEELIFFCLTADFIGLDINSLYVREYIKMDTLFYAFYGDMPVNNEWRYFIKDGAIQCKHPYWWNAPINGNLVKSGKHKTPKNWQTLLALGSRLTKREEATLDDYALRLAKVLKGYWSVDFIKTKKGSFVFTDAAQGILSCHQPDCKFCPTREEMNKATMDSIKMDEPDYSHSEEKK